MKPPRSGGGWKAIAYPLRMANRVGWWKLWTAMRSKNACKTCALGMGGQMSYGLRITRDPSADAQRETLC